MEKQNTRRQQQKSQNYENVFKIFRLVIALIFLSIAVLNIFGVLKIPNNALDLIILSVNLLAFLKTDQIS